MIYTCKHCQKENLLIYIYSLSYNGIIFYIGKTKNLKQRLSKHKSTSLIRENKSLKEEFIFNLLSEGKEINISIIETVDIDENEREIFWINYYKSEGIKLYNSTIGGDGGNCWDGKKHSDETKIKLKEISHNRVKNHLTPLPGSKNGRSKLSEDNVIEIRKLREELGLSYKELSIKFGISKTIIGYIILRKRWKHI